MTDYGHDLLFGSFLTPSASAPDRVVALSRRAEESGLDLVTFQDHPYQPNFLDAWTLLSHIGAATSRIRLANNVLNLPLRPPLVLARSAASLDLLTGGRVEIGLGSGSRWDVIEAAGGERRTPGQALAALDEAVQIIRAAWDTGQPGDVHVGGKHYRIAGAKRGPAPAHDMKIWIGGYKPRMLSLIGRTADGWWPSLPYLPGGTADLIDLNTRVDDAAAEAGRDPAKVRRLLNITGQFTANSVGMLTGPVEQWVDDITELALDHGISAFVLAADDPEKIERFGLDIAPAVRELVAAQRKPSDTDNKERERATPNQTLWNESTRPQAPPAPAGYDYTARGQAIAASLITVHDHLRSELAQIRETIDEVRQGARTPARARSVLNEMTMRQNNWNMGAYCESYCSVLTQHHSIEDVDRALVDFINIPNDFRKLQHAIDQLTDALLSHLTYEESTIIEPIRRYGSLPGQL
ncbi:MAG TPA: LLM class flavin-dependent oxidoreductase [Pseudonocardiaceae bacterium]|jgi:alkanesulfonate monooxygenase SsuD/methylene tetrahydromethanopterin reductase-like flavin-dependent oxidoreductase (luciferase family)